MLEGLKSEKCLNDAGFHIKRAWAKGFAGSDAERHARERPRRIDGVVMTEDEELAIGAGSGGRPDNAQVIATSFLLEDFHQGAAKHPLIREKATAAVGWWLFKAGGLQKGQFAKRAEHIPETRPQERQKSLRQRGRGHE